MTVESVPPVVDTTTKDNKGLAIASLVLGIISFCGAGIPYVNYCLILILLGGIVTGILGLKSSKKGLAIAGLVLSVLAICGVITSIIVWTGVGKALLQNPGDWEQWLNQLNQYNY